MWLLLALLWYSIHSSCVYCESASIKLGLLLPLTPGDTGITYGHTWARTAIIAAQSINNESFIPGYTLDLVVLDTLDTPAGTVAAAFQCAVTDHCVAVIGAAYSQYSMLVQYVLQNYSIPQVSPVSTATELSNKTQYPTFLRTIPADTAAGPAIAQVITHFQWKQVALIVGSDTYSNSLYKSFSAAAAQMNIHIVTESFLETIQPNFQARVAQIKDAYTQIIIVFAQQLEAEGILREGSAQGIMTKDFVWIGGDTLAGLNNYPTDALLGNLVITPSATANTPLAKQYLQQMSSFNSSAAYNSLVYDAVYAYANAFRSMVLTSSSWEDPHALLATLLETSFAGVSGNVSFYSNGDRVPYSYDIECWQANGQLMTVGMIDTNGQFTLVAPIVWSNNSTKVPADYLYLFRPPPLGVQITFDILAELLLICIGILLMFVFFSLLTKRINATTEKLAVNIPTTFGGILGCAAVLVMDAKVTSTHCIISTALMDASLLICGGVLAFMTLHKFIAEYKENAKKRCMSVTSVKVILYAAWGSIILLNLGALVASFLFEAPGVHLFRLEKNYYEHRCSFRQTFLFILPSTIGAMFAFAVIANFMKIFLNSDVAKSNILRTRRTDTVNSILHSATTVVILIGAVFVGVSTPTQIQVHIVSLLSSSSLSFPFPYSLPLPLFYIFFYLYYTLCTVILVANLYVPCNLLAWFTSTPSDRASYKLPSSPLPPRVQPTIAHSFRFDHVPTSSETTYDSSSETSPSSPSLTDPFLFIPLEKGSINVADLND